MKNINYISQSLNEFFNLEAEEISTMTGFIKRKINGASFVKALVLGNKDNTNCSIDEMTNY